MTGLIKDGAPVWVLGCMSGTSMDGVDAALLKTDGLGIADFGMSKYAQYTDSEKEILALAQKKSAGRLEPAETERAERVVREKHASLIKGMECEAVGFHGHTLAHDPDRGYTCQTGRGDLLASQINKTVVWDFRSEDMSLKGQGAPLAPAYHFALARRLGETGPVAFLNLGGVGNVTWVNPEAERPEEEGALLAFDTGPANALVDDAVKRRAGKPFDEGGDLALSGRVHESVVEEALKSDFHHKRPPKSADRNQFGETARAVESLSLEDACATLVEITVRSVAMGMRHAPGAGKLLVTGGGRRNPAMMGRLRELLDTEVLAVDEEGLDGDMLEAQAFAYLAARVIRGLPTAFPSTTGATTPSSGGRISRPDFPESRREC